MRNCPKSIRVLRRPRWEQRGITGLETAIVLIAFVVVSSVFAFAALSTGLFSSDKAKETINAGLSETRGTLEVRGSIIAKSLSTADEVVINTGSLTTGTLAYTPIVPRSETLTRLPGPTTLTRVNASPTGDQYTINNETGFITLGTASTGGSTVSGDYSAQLIDEISFQVANAAGGEAVDLTPGETLITYTDVDQSLTLATADLTITALGNADTDKLVEPGEMYEMKITGLVSSLSPDLPKDKAFSIEVKPPQGAVVHLERMTPVVLEKINDLG